MMKKISKLKEKICGDILVVLEILIIRVIIVTSTVLIYIIMMIIGGKPTLKHEFNVWNGEDYNEEVN